ncbi:hypothetical protein [Gayadomonas joobiniege]|uniref:hypothetical protein n=1 Tax=Gayadomonas joobiniege TaxID=1234606 RepID=UPI0003748B53|nr:hypothetical protein [Gayadomonas joobiniege]
MPKTKKDKEKKQNKKNTSLRLDGDTLQALKDKAASENTSVQKVLEQLVTAYLHNKIKMD